MSIAIDSDPVIVLPMTTTEPKPSTRRRVRPLEQLYSPQVGDHLRVMSVAG